MTEIKTEAAKTKNSTSVESPLVPSEPPGNTETGGPKGLEPTRYGDWEKNGRCIDF
jgi:hypothetical protein